MQDSKKQTNKQIKKQQQTQPLWVRGMGAHQGQKGRAWTG